MKLSGAVLLALPLVALGLVAQWLLPGATARLATLLMIYVIAVVGTGVYTGNSGIMSFGHCGFMALGAYASGLVTINPRILHVALPHLPPMLHGLAGHSLWLGLVAALLVVAVTALVFGLPMARLGGEAATIVTLGFLVIVYVVLVASGNITRGSQTFFGIPSGLDPLTVMPIAALSVVLARLYKESHSGLALRAAREDDIAATSIGVNIPRERFAAWLLSALLCGVAGALLAHFLGAFSPKDFYFNLTFLLMAMLILGGISTVTGALGGTVVMFVVLQLLRQIEGGATIAGVHLPPMFGLTSIGGALVILLSMYKLRDGLFGLRELDERFADRLAAPGQARTAAGRPGTGVERLVGKLEVDGVGRRFGGLIALEDVSFTVEPGQVVGLIGPNGAGKSTLINAISGVVPASSGTVRLGGHDVAQMPVHKVPLAGLGRTFQNIRLFRNLTVLENVRAAAEAAGARGEAAVTEARAALAAVGLAEMSGRLAATLPYGAQRRLEIARALALRPSFLLLDEPAAGMNPTETNELIAVLRQIREDHSIGLMVVEHDLKLIMRLCDRIVVLNKGRKIAEGTPDEVRADPHVVEAYIGSRAAEAV
ncbi:branched-chain amino acid ABC transporter ATP-binding protein/permease [Acidimangrovimonas pyrenivorans]|uniref:ATP-binding cassette domain-containing protein n=1 Tax=Acidimangrovimonas pyrenivorans TaxID=2030798 RepID=A0ABV7AHT4_9RHOB